MKNIKALNIHGTLSRISEKELQDLQSTLRGRLLLPSEEAYEQSRTLWNAMIDKKPAFIVRVRGTVDVIAAVRFAKQHDLLLSVRAAGHNIAGRALEENAMLIDLEDLRQVFVDPDNKVAWVSPGATLGDIDHETQMYGLALPLGINSTTGISGLTLGGGFGWLSRKYAMTVDSLLAVEVITTDGKRLYCDNNNHSDLFWAVRGGGGNFGIVTGFHFKLHPVGPEVQAGPIVFPISEAGQILKRYRDFCKSNPEEMSLWSVIRHAPPFPFLDEKYHGKPVIIMVCLYVGDAASCAPLVDAVRQFGNPIGDGFGPHSFCQFQTAFDPLLTPGARNYWKSHNFNELNDATIDLLLKYAAKLPSMESEIFVAQMGGATNRVDADATAYPHRDVQFIMNVHTRWQEASMDKPCIDWARDFYKATLPHATGGVYVNFVSEGDDDIDQAYSSNIQKLKQVKAKYDPNNRLRSNLNIQPI